MTRRPAANVLFPNAVPTPEEANVVPNDAGAEMPSINKPGRRKTEDVLFGKAVLEDSVINDNYERIADHEGLTREQREAEQGAYGHVRQELDLGQDESRRLHSLVTDWRLRGETESWTKQAETWPKRTRQMLRERHGEKGESLLEHVDAYVGARPALGKLLQGGLHRHPEVVDMLVERVRHPWRYQQD